MPDSQIIQKVQSKKAGALAIIAPLMVASDDVQTKLLLTVVLAVYVVCQTIIDKRES